jgi:hypothetical protein
MKNARLVCFYAYLTLFTILASTGPCAMESKMLLRCMVLAECKPIIAYRFQHDAGFREISRALANKYIDRDLNLYGEIWMDLRVLNEDRARREIAMDMSGHALITLMTRTVAECLAETMLFTSITMLLYRFRTIILVRLVAEAVCAVARLAGHLIFHYPQLIAFIFRRFVLKK